MKNRLEELRRQRGLRREELAEALSPGQGEPARVGIRQSAAAQGKERIDKSLT